MARASTNRRFFSDGILYGVPLLLARSVGLLLLPLYTRELGPAGFGVVEATIALVQVLLVVATLEINQAQARLLADQSDQAGARRLFIVALLFSFSTCTAIAGLLHLALPAILERWPVEPLGVTAANWALAMFVTLAALQVVQVHLRFAGRLIASGAVNLIVTGATVAAVLSFLAADSLQLSDYFAAQVIGAGSGASLGILMILRGASRSVLRGAPGLLREMLSYSWPLFFSSTFIVLAASAERLAVASQIGTEELGRLGVALRLAGIMAIAFSVLSTVLTPHVYLHHADAETRGLIRRLFVLVAAACIALLALVTVASGPIIALVAGPGFEHAADFLFFVLLTAMLSNAYVFFLGMDIAKKTVQISRINMLSGSLVLVGSFIAARWIGVWGVIAVAMVGAVLKIVLYYRGSQGHYPLQLPWRGVAIAAATLLIVNLLSITNGI